MNIFPKDSRVIFTGDSITAQCKYITRITDYYNKNRPELNVKFFAGAESGGTLNNAIRFFKDNVLPFKPTHATVCFGVNDCRLWLLGKENHEERDTQLREAYERYKTNLNTYIDMLTENKITPILLTPAPYAEYMKIDSPAHANGHRLVYEYAEVMRNTAKERGLELADLHARLSELYMIEELYGADRVHPTDLGQFRMAEAFLRSQGLDIGDYRPLDELLKDKFTGAWQKTAYRFCRIYGAYTNMSAALYDMPYDEQMSYISEYVLNHSYGANNALRDFSTEFAVLKPIENELIARIEVINEGNL